MRLTLVLVFATLGIVAKTKPKSDPLLVKAHVAGEIKSGSTGIRCEEKAKYKEVAGTVLNYCPMKNSDKETSGNYVIAAFDKKILDINYVEAYKCDPKPDDCNCKSLLTGVVQNFPRASKISLIFTATPAIAGCKCYLGTAARNGFKKVDVENCDTIIDFDEKNYSKKCDDLIKRADQCYVGNWYIKK